jgi:hypothetical protein
MSHMSSIVALILSLHLASALPALAQSEPRTPYGKCAKQLGGQQSEYNKKWLVPPGRQDEHDECVRRLGAKPRAINAKLPTCQDYKISLGGSSFERGGTTKLRYYGAQGTCR